MARIFSLIGSLCSTGSMRLNLAQIPGSAGFQPASEKDWLKQIDSPKIFSAQRHGTQASGLCAKRTFLSAFRWHRSGVELRWAYRPGGLCPELPKRAVRQFPPATFGILAEYSSSTNVRSRECYEWTSRMLAPRNRCSKQSSSTPLALSSIQQKPFATLT